MTYTQTPLAQCLLSTTSTYNSCESDTQRELSVLTNSTRHLSAFGNNLGSSILLKIREKTTLTSLKIKKAYLIFVSPYTLLTKHLTFFFF